MDDLVLDGHAHCGVTVPFEEIAYEWQTGGIHGGVIFSPVEEIYDRYDPSFKDSQGYRRSRSRVHEYLLEIASRENIFPYFFVWNDFSPIPDKFVGIKWHRHSGEPVYSYGTAPCLRIIDDICERGLPIVLEEEFHHTLAIHQRDCRPNGSDHSSHGSIEWGIFSIEEGQSLRQRESLGGYCTGRCP